MNGRVIHLGTDVHQKVQALLPWYVGARLDADECARVEAHIAECPRCQAELAWERQLQAVLAADTSAPASDAGRGFARLRERMAAAAPRRRDGLLARLGDLWRESPAWTRRALAAQCVVVAALSGLLLLPTPTEQRFRALGASAGGPGGADRGNLIVRFRPEATEQEVRRALRDSEARLVDGPTATDAYLLAVPPGRETAAVQRLRKEGAVLLVESLVGRAAP